MLAKKVINIILLLVILITSLPVKQAGRLFYKKQIQTDMCDDDCDDQPVKKADDTLGFKPFPCCHHQHYTLFHPLSQSALYHLCHISWRLPLWPATDIPTPPPNYYPALAA